MKKLIITDLDDTIWKWFDMWYISSNNFFNNISKFCNIELETLYQDFRKIHQKYHTSESSNEIQELTTLNKEDVDFIYNASVVEEKSIIHKYHSDRLHNLSLYPDVLSTLETLKEKGMKIIGFTESNTFHTLRRIQQLNLEPYFHSIYAPIDLGKKAPHERYYNDEHYQPTLTKIIELSKGTKKPNKVILDRILNENSTLHSEAIYVGDKLQKDVFMANKANVFSVHAKYGDIANDPRYELLRKVSHWSNEDVEYERKIQDITSKVRIEPRATITNFKQVLHLI